MAKATITLLQPNPVSGRADMNVKQVKSLVEALPATDGPNLIVVPLASLEGATGDRALGWVNAQKDLHEAVQSLLTLVVPGRSILMAFTAADGQTEYLFLSKDTPQGRIENGTLFWQDLSLALSQQAGGEAVLCLNELSYCGTGISMDSERPLLVAGIAGGDGERIYAGETGLYGSETAALPLWQAGALQVQRTQDGRWVEAARTQPAYAPCCADERYEALRAGLRDYVNKAGIPGVVLGLSGGIDSALVLALAVDALGADRVRCVLLPSRFTSAMSLTLARQAAKNAGVQLDELSIEGMFEQALTTLSPVFGPARWDVTEENIQARIRGLLLMAMANKQGRLLLCTSNKAEAAMGYGTLYGDLTGGYAPLIDLWKDEVVALCRARNASETSPDLIPEGIIEREPSAELRAGQLDSDALPPYDDIRDIVTWILMGEPVEQLQGKYDRTVIARVTAALTGTIFKRAQSIPGPQVSPYPLALIRDWPTTQRVKLDFEAFQA